MTPTDVVVILVIALAVGGALFYIIRAKRRGKKCIGCPYADSCGKNCPSQQKQIQK